MCRRVIEQLAGKGVQVVALVRDVEKARKVLPGSDAGVTLISGDVYQFATLPAALQGCDAVICATGPKDPLDPLGPFQVDYTVRVQCFLFQN